MKSIAILTFALLLLSSPSLFGQQPRSVQYDLTCTSFTSSPANPKVGDSLSFEYTIANLGNDPVPLKPYAIDLFFDGNRLAFDHAPSAITGKPGHVIYTIPATKQSRVLTNGVHNLKLVIDPENRLRESNRKNNIYQRSIFIK